MESPKMNVTSPIGSLPSSNEENQRVKFLCSFSGSILPRPQDGKLRYVGGETRMVSAPRDINYEELMGKMRELLEGATVLKYQQPDEDLDALVSVVNDDDVTNMMEEYDKLGSTDGFTRLRIFLFSHPDQDGSLHFGDGDERDHERRYIDALNSLNESPDTRRQPLSDFQVTGAVDDIHPVEQYFNQISIDGGFHNQRNFDIPTQINLRHLTIPHVGSVQHPQSVIDASWSPVYYSPRQHAHQDSRPITDFSSSPPSACYRMPRGDFIEKTSDRVHEEYSRQQLSHQSSLEPQSQCTDNVVYVPTGAVSGEKSVFPGNIVHGSGVIDGSISESHQTALQRTQTYHNSPWKPGEQPLLDSSCIGNGFHHVPTTCVECFPNREMVTLNADSQSRIPFFSRELNDPRFKCNETQTYDRGWIKQPHLNARVEEPRSHISGSGRLNDPSTIENNGMNTPAVAYANLPDGHYLPSHYGHHEDSRLVRPVPDSAHEVFLEPQSFAAGAHIHIPFDERGVRYGNFSYAYGVDNHYQVSHGHVPSHALWRNSHHPVQGVPFEGPNIPRQPNGMVNPASLMRCTMEGSSRYPVAVENQNPWVESPQKVVGIDGPNAAEYPHSHASNPVQSTYNQEQQLPLTQDCTTSPYDTLNNNAPNFPVLPTYGASVLIDDKLVSPITSVLEASNDVQVNGSIRMEKTIILGGEEMNKFENANTQSISVLERDNNVYPEASIEPIVSTSLMPPLESHSLLKAKGNGVQDGEADVVQLPNLIECVKGAVVAVEEVKASVLENSISAAPNETPKLEIQHEQEAMEAQGEVEMDSDNDRSSNSKIEPTQAEEEAIAKGLQTINNDDLEEVRELGSGTYGAVYHGKWRGSDVAIKRIKASCFAGKPSERERLIADFWKEALILSSLHHPNVVSFYGIVRDGPDGSLATVTEFMINGSLKQFLRKKDRTIDRRKRLIIAMDAAFGMEYLHGKNIVHFDLKCENLLVNMRDPHRPVCKIGDLGLSKVKQHTLVSGGVRGTLPWMAPELLSGKSNMVTEKIDVYSFGIVMWELLTGDEPYADMHCASIIGGIVNNSLRPEIPSWCDPEWKALMESCWASDPAQRPSFSEISQKLRNMGAAINVK